MKVKNNLLNYKNMVIYQDTKMFSFSLDSVLLANFVTINSNINNILDIGCGNAPIPLILTTKTKAHITGVEIQKDVYDLALCSVEENNLSSQISLINDDINHLYYQYESDVFDVITCNPPYFKNEDKSNKNISEYKKIARHEIYLNLEQVFSISKKLLKNNGVVAIVHRPDRLIDIINIMRKNNIEPCKLQLVYPKIGLNANLILVEGRKNGKGGLKILPPLYVHNEDGTYRNSIKKCFENR